MSAEITQPIQSRLSSPWKTLFARRTSGPDGEFLGVIEYTVEPAYFEAFFGSIALDEQSSISLWHRDGTLLACYPHVDAVGTKPPTDAVIQHMQTSAEPATMRRISPFDGIDRLASVRLLRDFPIALVTTTTVDGVLADWRVQTGS